MAFDGENQEQIKKLSSQMFRCGSWIYTEWWQVFNVKRRDGNKYQIVQWRKKNDRFTESEKKEKGK